MSEAISIDIRKLKLDPHLQMRAAMSDSAIEEYCDNLFDLPPIKVAEDVDGSLWVWDGFHSVTAHLKMKQHTIKAIIAPGSFMDALALAAGANASHGVRRSPEDKRKAIASLLAYPLWRERSDRMIAETCRVSHVTVARVRQEIEAAEAKASQDSGSNGKSTGNVSSSKKAKPKKDPSPTTRTGKDGKARKAKEAKLPTCERCKRLKVDNPDCQACAALRRNRAEQAQDKAHKADGEPDAVYDDDGCIVPAMLRSAFESKELYRSADMGAARMAETFKALENVASYKDAHSDQNDKMKYSNFFRTAALKARALRPSVVCQDCRGEGCPCCKSKGYLTVGEREEAGAKM